MLLSKASFPGQAAAIPAVAAAELLNIAPVYSVDRIFTRSFCTSCGPNGAKVHDSAAMVKFGRTMPATGARKAGAMRALVVTADLGGNLPPRFSVARALQRRGVEITFAGLDLANTHFRTTRFEVALAITPERGSKGLRKGVAMARLAAGRALAREAQRLITEARPDVVLVDCMLIAPLRGVLAAGRPTAVLFHTFGEYWSHDFDRGPAGRVLALLGLRPRKLWRAAAARLMLTDAELDRGSTTPEMRDYTWVGSTEPGTEPLARGNRDRVLVALSATDWPGMLPVYRSIVAALAALPVEAVVTTGGVDLGDELRGRHRARLAAPRQLAPGDRPRDRSRRAFDDAEGARPRHPAARPTHQPDLGSTTRRAHARGRRGSAGAQTGRERQRDPRRRDGHTRGSTPPRSSRGDRSQAAAQPAWR